MEGEGLNITIRNLQPEDYEDLLKCMEAAYASIPDPPWSEDEFLRLLEIFPEGQIAVEVNGHVAGAAMALIVDYARFGEPHTYEEVTDRYRFGSHNPKGDVLYGIDVFVHPEYRGMRLGRRLYDARKELCENLNLRAILSGGRIPGYGKHAKEMTPRQYIERVENREIYDPILSFQLSNGFRVKRVLRRYLETDPQSKAFATLLEWDNIYYQEKPQLIAAPKTEVRIGIVQWQMRPAATLQTILDQAEYFLDTLGDYACDFAVFPEFFNAPLMQAYNDLTQAEAIREVAAYTPQIVDAMSGFAVSYNVNIVAGSMPYLDDGQLYNVAPFCRRDGSVETVRKIHVTPSERDSYAILGGTEITALNSDCGKIGICICYDVEFPELVRLLRAEGMQLLFVPFMTDLQTGYHRVRFCAQSRAIENECYVAIAGSVGNLPRVDNMDIQFSQSAVFSPSDFAFPSNGIVAEATPNTEMVLIADVNLALLKELHEIGSVTNWKDRRLDLYQLRARKPSEAKPRAPKHTSAAAEVGAAVRG